MHMIPCILTGWLCPADLLLIMAKQPNLIATLPVLSGMQDSTEDSELLEGEHMEQREGEAESPFSQLALAGVIPETPTSSQDCERNEEREEEVKERNTDNSVASSTIVLSPDTLDSSAAACNDGDSMSIGGSTRNEDTVLCVPEETHQQTDLNMYSEMAGSAMGDYLPLETGPVESVPPSTSGGCQEGESLVDKVIGESGGEEEGDAEEEGSAIGGVESVEVKQELLEEEETEPQARCVLCTYMYRSLGRLYILYMQLCSRICL